MILEYGEYGTLEYWNESIVIEIDQEPDFLDPFEAMEVEKGGGKEKIYTLKLRNRNLFADASPLQKGGIPILPPPKPWIITINGWIIDVEGEYVRYEVRDGEQVVVREKKKIYDGQNKLIGYNTPIRFSFTTGTFIAVPPGPQGVGDRLGGGTCEASPGWKC